MTVQTRASLLVQTYLALGRKRRTAADDNAMSTWLLDDGPVEAQQF